MPKKQNTPNLKTLSFTIMGLILVAILLFAGLVTIGITIPSKKYSSDCIEITRFPAKGIGIKTNDFGCNLTRVTVELTKTNGKQATVKIKEIKELTEHSINPEDFKMYYSWETTKSIKVCGKLYKEKVCLIHKYK